MKYESVNKAVIDQFDSGSHAFNIFIKEKAEEWQSVGETVTYLCVLRDEMENDSITRVYAYASLNTMGLLYSDDEENRYLPCVEIRIFAIAKQLRCHHDPSIQWSTIIFKTLLQELYLMSISVVGFKAIFLNSNHEGFHLYTNCGFQEIRDFIPPDEDEKIEVSDCTPLLLVLSDDTIGDFFI